MAPEFEEGDFVLINEIPFFLQRLTKGDIIIFNHKKYGILIKKIDSFFPNQGFFVRGIHKNSLDSNQLGYIPRPNVMGKVIWHIRKHK
jgi:signal peptidase I